MTNENQVPFYLIQTLLSLRLKYGLTTFQIAEKLTVTHEQYMEWENDSSSIPYSHILKLEEVFQMPAKYMYFGKDITLSNEKRFESESSTN